MKKLIALISVLGIFATGVVFASTTTVGVIQMSATMGENLSVSLTPDTPVNYGTFISPAPINSSSVGGTKTLTNTGNVDATLKIAGSGACYDADCWALRSFAGGSTFMLEFVYGGGTPTAYHPEDIVFTMGDLLKGANKSLNVIFNPPTDSSNLGVPYTWTSTVYVIAK